MPVLRVMISTGFERSGVPVPAGQAFTAALDNECALDYDEAYLLPEHANPMPRLFSYTIPVDDGAAPNPFYGMCSLAICKPGIRRVAQQGDWVAGLGAKNAPSGDLSARLVYAMCVEEVLSLHDYDRQALARWPHRIPKVKSMALHERLGDCIYDFASGVPVQRPGVHGPGNVTTDLRGNNVLLSRDFYYFGSRAEPLPNYLLPICHQTQGHKSTSNAPYLNQFIAWIRSKVPTPGQLYGWPDFIVEWNAVAACGGCTIRQLDNENDPDC
jgi:Nucleotide modification associated domain 2